MEFDLSIASTVVFKLTINSIGWFGFGFGRSMTNVDMVIFEFPPSSEDDVPTVRSTDSYSHGLLDPSSDVSLGG